MAATINTNRTIKSVLVLFMVIKILLFLEEVNYFPQPPHPPALPQDPSPHAAFAEPHPIFPPHAVVQQLPHADTKLASAVLIPEALSPNLLSKVFSFCLKDIKDINGRLPKRTAKRVARLIAIPKSFFINIVLSVTILLLSITLI